MSGPPGAIRVYTIGHSTRPLPEFLALLQGFHIATLADIRSYPGSRKYPHFNGPALAAALEKAGIRYEWLPALGGRRHRGLGDASPNGGLRHPSFRNYADHMLTREFRAGIERLLELASAAPTAIMCAEAVYWRCHRRLVSDDLVAHGIEVLHIMGAGSPRPHHLTAGTVVRPDSSVIYPGQSGTLWANENAPS